MTGLSKGLRTPGRKVSLVEQARYTRVKKKVVTIAADTVVAPVTPERESSSPNNNCSFDRECNPTDGELTAGPARKTRPSSAPARRPRSRPSSAAPTPDPEESARQLRASFTRSLRLLGLQHEIALATRPRPPKPPRVEGPTFSTRLAGRSVSLDSLHHVGTVADRRALASVVYQEWYFSKMQQERDKRLQDAAKRHMQAQMDEQRKAELRAKAQENFAVWLRNKAEEKAETARREREKRQREMQKLREDAERIQKTLAEWSTAKEQKLRREAKLKKEKEAREAEKKRKEEEEKRQHAREAYAAWQKKAREYAAAQAEKEKRAREAEEAKRRSKQQRQLEAAGSFVAWREAKDKQLRARLRALRLAEKRATEDRRKRLAERIYEAEQAYVEWLDAVEERQRPSSPS